MDRSTENVLTFAKMLISSGGQNDCEVTSDIYHGALEKLARAEKRDGESLQQAYNRIGQQTEAGQLLLKAAIWGPAPKQAPQDFVEGKKEPKGPVARELQELAEYMAKEKNLSVEQATTRLMTDPSRKDLLQRLLQEERHATAEVRSQRFPMPAKL